jgi:glycerophosphoryl diester phosphodiesterase
MSTNTDALLEMRRRLPGASYCQGAGKGNAAMIDAAIEHGFDKVQIVSWHPYDKAMIDRCHENGIICNFCQANNAPFAKELLDMGIDCILTDDLHRVKSELEKIL